MASPVEAERYIRFQLEHLTARNEHHTFEEICYRIAKRRLSSNLLPATGPVSAGGDQGRDAETYYTRLPQELPSAGGFVGRATSEPLVVACSVQKDGLEAKARADVKKICEQGSPVTRIAFFVVQDVPVAARHRIQEDARKAHGVALEIFDGQAVSHLLAEADLVWVAERYLDLPSHLVPDSPDEPQPRWYAHTLKALRERKAVWLTPGTFSEVRDGLRHATFDDTARSDLPEWLEYMREFTADGSEPELAIRARYECAVATLRGLGTLAGAEDDIRMVLDSAVASESPSIMEDASILLMYWGGAWVRHLATAAAEELRNRNLALRTRVNELLAGIDETKHPNRAARLLAVAAHLCLHPRWPEANRPPAGTLPEPREMTLLRRALDDAGETVVADPDMPVDSAEALGYLDRLVDLLPAAQVFPVGRIAETFQVLAPVLMRDPRYAKVRDSLDAAVAAVEGDHAVARRRRARAMAFRRAGRLLEALAELHEIKMDLWHGDTLRGALITIRSIGRIYAELQMPHAAKQYALAAAGIALTSGDAELHDLGPEALIDVMDDCHAAGAWGDAMAVANLAAAAHGSFAEDAFNLEAHASLQRLDFHTMLVLLAAERFRPGYFAVLRSELGQTGYMHDLITNGLDTVRSAFNWTEEVFIWHADEQLSGRPFSDLGRRRTLTFAALGMAWQITCPNNRHDVLAAERFAAALQILIVELAPHDPVFLPQDVHLELITGTRLAGRSPVRFKPTKDRADCTVVLTPFTEDVDEEALNEELDVAVIFLLRGLSARPEADFMNMVERAVSLSFNLFPGQHRFRCAWHACFAGEKVAGSWAFAAAFGPAGPGAGGFRDTGGCPQAGADVAKPPADPSRGQRPGGIGLFLPGAAEVGGQGAGEEELGVRGHEEPDPAVCLLRGPHLRGGEAENALEGADRVLDVEPGEVGAPELVQGQRAGAGVPQPHGPVRVAAVGQALDGDVDEGAAQDRQVFRPANQPRSPWMRGCTSCQASARTVP